MSAKSEEFLRWFHITHIRKVTYDETYEKEMEHDWRVWKAAQIKALIEAANVSDNWACEDVSRVIRQMAKEIEDES